MTPPSRSAESFRFADRRNAGIALARQLRQFANRNDVVVLAPFGALQALEIDTMNGRFIRPAFRATALPEQLDGLAPGELSSSERSTEATATLTAATHPTAPNES